MKRTDVEPDYGSETTLKAGASWSSKTCRIKAKNLQHQKQEGFGLSTLYLTSFLILHIRCFVIAFLLKRGGTLLLRAQIKVWGCYGFRFSGVTVTRTDSGKSVSYTETVDGGNLAPP